MVVWMEVSIVFFLGNFLWSSQIPGVASGFGTSRVDCCRVLSRSGLRRICASTHSTAASVSVASSLFAMVTGSRHVNPCSLEFLAFYPCQFIAVNPFRALIRWLIDRYSIATIFVLAFVGAISFSPRITVQCWACLGLSNVTAPSSVNGVMKFCTGKIVVGVHFATNPIHTRVVRVGVAVLGSEVVLLGKVMVGCSVHIVVKVLANRQQPAPATSIALDSILRCKTLRTSFWDMLYPHESAWP
jgi:hypothetical protein